MISTNKKRKSSSCPFAGAKKAPKRKKSSKRLSKDRAEDLAASDKGSYFEQEQLLALTTKENPESQDDDEMVCASHAKILQRTTEESQGTERQESWQNMTGRTIVSGNGLPENLAKSVNCRFCHSDVTLLENVSARSGLGSSWIVSCKNARSNI